jgi:cytochrome c556
MGITMQRGRLMIRSVLAAGALVAATVAALAQSSPLEQRNALMKSMWRDGWRSITFMVRGREPYDQAKVDAGFAKVNEIAAKLPPLWPQGSTGTAPEAGFTSTAKIWENKADFDAKLAAFTKAAADARGKVKNLDELKTVFAGVDKTCDNCHEPYRVQVRR